MTVRVPVVIVGAGPVGTSAAILLAQQGTECIVLERWTEVYPQPRAVHLDDEIHRVLGTMGLAEEFSAISRPAAGLRLVDRHHRILGTLTRSAEDSPNGHPGANLFDQPDLEAILRRRLEELPLATLRTGVEVTGVRVDAHGVTLELTDLGTGRSERLETDYVLGADGSHSVVREAIGASLESLPFEQRWLVVDAVVGTELGHWDGVHQVCDARRAATYMRIGPTRHRWEFQLMPSETLEDYRSIEQLEPLLASWTAAAAPGDVHLVRTAEYTFRAALADRWRRGRGFLLGDAAHLTPPFIGQGLGAGLRDAANLTWKLSGVLQGRLDVSVLDTYEAERRPHARSLVQIARAVGLAMTSGGHVGTVARRALLPLASRVLARSKTSGRGVTPALTAGELVHAERRDRLAGSLCPNVVGSWRLDDDHAGHWILLTREAPAPGVVGRLESLGCHVVLTDPGDRVDRWLTEADRPAALVRPDLIVMASGPTTVLASALEGVLAPASSRPREAPHGLVTVGSCVAQPRRDSIPHALR